MEERKTTEAQRKASAKYNKNKTLSMSLCFNRLTDADIVEKLQGVENKQGYIKSLIRSDIQKPD